MEIELLKMYMHLLFSGLSSMLQAEVSFPSVQFSVKICVEYCFYIFNLPFSVRGFPLSDPCSTDLYCFQ